MAFATFKAPDGSYSLYRVRLLTGKADRIGRLDKNVLDIAIPLNQR